MLEKIKPFLQQCSRVLYVLRKPSMKEYRSIAKISLVGILLIGLIGFLISILVHLF